MKFAKKYYIQLIVFSSFIFANTHSFSQEARSEVGANNNESKTESAPKSEVKVSEPQKQEVKEPKLDRTERIEPREAKEEHKFPEIKSVNKLEYSINDSIINLSNKNNNSEDKKKHILELSSQINNKNINNKDIKTEKNERDAKNIKDKEAKENKSKEDEKKSNQSTKQSAQPANTLSLDNTQNVPENNIKNDITPSHIKIDNTAIKEPEHKDIQDNTISQYGKIIAKKDLPDNITAWVVEKNSRRIILYTSANKSIVIHGIAWNTKNKQNINQTLSGYLAINKLVPVNNETPYSNNSTDNLNVAATQNNNWQDKKFSTPDIITALSNIYGIKEGNANILDTVYVFFDPRCPYCRQAYIRSRTYIAGGKSIKWIPVLVLGNDEQAQKNAGNLLQSPVKQQADLLKRTLENKENFDIKLNSNTKHYLLVNKQSLSILSAKSGMDNIAVPVAFFFDKRSGKTKYLKGIHTPEVLQEIFKGI